MVEGERKRDESEYGNRDMRFQSERFALNPRWPEIEKLIDDKNFLFNKLMKEDKFMEGIEIKRKYEAEINYYDILNDLILSFNDIYDMFVWFSELDKKFRYDAFEMFEEYDLDNTKMKNIISSLDEIKAKYLGWLLKTYYNSELMKKYNEFIEEENYESLAIIKKYSLDINSMPNKE